MKAQIQIVYFNQKDNQIRKYSTDKTLSTIEMRGFPRLSRYILPVAIMNSKMGG